MTKNQKQNHDAKTLELMRAERMTPLEIEELLDWEWQAAKDANFQAGNCEHYGSATATDDDASHWGPVSTMGS